MRFKAHITLLFAIISTTLSAQNHPTGFGVAYYDVGELYDTEKSELYDDADFTPQGKMRWDEARYRRKVEHTVQVIDSMAMPVVVLYGVENEKVVRDLVTLSKGDYAYLHHDQNIGGGLEFAVLYQGDRFFPERVTPWSGALAIEGSAGKVPFTIIASKRSSSLGVLMERLNINAISDNIILIGQFRKESLERVLPSLGSQPATQQEQPNKASFGGWIVQDQCLASTKLKHSRGVYIKHWLLDNSGRPLGTFGGKHYRGGYSSSLPIYIYFMDLFAD